MPLRRRLGLLLALAAPASVSAQSLVIVHEPADCVAAESRPQVRACVEPLQAVQQVSVLFRREGEADWRSVEMEGDGDCFAALLPKLERHLAAMHYQIEALDRTMSPVRSPEFRVAVVKDREGCSQAVEETNAAAGTAQGVTGASRKGSPAGPRGGGSGALKAAVIGGGAAAAGGVALAATKGKSAQTATSPPTTTAGPAPTSSTTTTAPTTSTTTSPTTTTTTAVPTTSTSTTTSPATTTAPTTSTTTTVRTTTTTTVPTTSSTTTVPTTSSTTTTAPTTSTTTTAPTTSTTTTVPTTSTTTTAPTTSTTTTAPTTSTTTVPTTTTTSVPSCAFGASPDRTFPILGGSGSCNITASPASCRWNAEVSPSSATWLTLSGPSSGTGNGSVSYNVAINTIGARSARIRLRENPSAACTISQAGVLMRNQHQEDEVGWTSHLDVAGGRGQVVVDGNGVLFQEHGFSQGGTRSRGLVHRIEAVLVDAAGEPGRWRFELSGAFVPGSLQAAEGQVIDLAGDAIVFRLEGKPGERVVFTFR